MRLVTKLAVTHANGGDSKLMQIATSMRDPDSMRSVRMIEWFARILIANLVMETLESSDKIDEHNKELDHYSALCASSWQVLADPEDVRAFVEHGRATKLRDYCLSVLYHLQGGLKIPRATEFLVAPSQFLVENLPSGSRFHNQSRTRHAGRRRDSESRVGFTTTWLNSGNRYFSKLFARDEERTKEAFLPWTKNAS
jgi:hypothetical protein